MKEYDIFLYFTGNLAQPETLKTVVMMFGVRKIFEDPLSGLDFAIKCYFALDSRYPAKCGILWMMIQRLFYQLVLKEDEKFLTLAVSRFLTTVQSEIPNLFAIDISSSFITQK